MLPVVLALTLGTPAHAEEVPAPPVVEPAPNYDPGAVIAVGTRLAGALALMESGAFTADAMVDLSVEARIDKRTSVRFEGGFNPIRGRIHVLGAGRVYPAGKGRLAWWAEASVHAQRTGRRERPSNLWIARPARFWASLPLLYGAGWRIMATETLVIDLGVHGGPILFVEPDADFPFGFGFAVSGHALIGTSF